jgi:LPXTG-motif cell wall-anchored protein
VRGLLAALVLGLIMLLGMPLAHAGEYPPGPPGPGTSARPAPPGQPLEQLAETGGDVGRELGVGAGLIAAGGAILVVTRRRRGVRG